MPRYIFHNPTSSRILIPGTGIWINPKRNRTLDIRATVLDNPELAYLLEEGALRMSKTVESKEINDEIEIPVVSMLDDLGGGPGGGIETTDIRRQRVPAGAVDGANTTFFAPDTFVHDPPNETVQVYLNGQRLTDGDFTVSGGLPGEGTTINMVLAPIPGDKLRIDYVVA